MVQPIDYTLDVVNPVQSSLQGFTGGLQLGMAVEDRKRAVAQAQRDQLAKEQMNKDLFNLSQNPSYEGYTQVMTKYPQLAENLKRAYDTMDSGKQQRTFSLASQAYAALSSQRPEIAKQVLDDAAIAYENSGNKQDAGVLRGYLKMIDTSPEAARTSIGMLMSSVNPDKFKDVYSTLGGEQRANEMQPYDIAESKAKTAYTEAQTNDIPLAAEDRRAGVDNQGRKIEYDNQFNYDKLSQDQQQFYDGLDKTERIEAAKLRSTKGETPEQKMKRLEQAESYSVAARNAASASTSAANLASDIAGIKDSTGGYWNRAMRNIPGFSEYDFAQKVETMKSQVFLSQIDQMRGLGALTESEGAALKASIASLDLNQSPDIFQKNLTQIAKTLSAAAKTASKKAQIYSTRGMGYSPDIINASRELGISPAEAQKFVNENGL
ncbi:hypothetical protein VXS72_15640 [Acinetobacter pittii]|uniref:hypothetical protein n=1 Tax=Acinetobacter pittii TaxID=48296 RepID=UPI002E17BC15|nr:hypothetical protein [Acinetobacter pittii]